MRLVRYTAGQTEYVPGTTLRESDGFSIADLSELYHHHWRSKVNDHPPPILQGHRGVEQSKRARHSAGT